MTYEQLVARGPIDVLGATGDYRDAFGTNLSDRVFGEPCDQFLWGGEGDDHYFFNLGDGVHRIIDVVSDTDGNEIVFGSGISISTLSLGVGDGFDDLERPSSLIIRVGVNGDEIRLVNFDVGIDDVLGSQVVATYRFTDGSSWSHSQLLGLGFDHIGSDGDDVLVGTNRTDRFVGGAGNDIMEGKEGNDTYLFKLGDGIDTIHDVALVGEGNRIQFGVGIDNSALTFTRDETARTLTIQVGSSGADQLALTNFDPTEANGSLVVRHWPSPTGVPQIWSISSHPRSIMRRRWPLRWWIRRCQRMPHSVLRYRPLPLPIRMRAMC